MRKSKKGFFKRNKIIIVFFIIFFIYIGYTVISNEAKYKELKAEEENYNKEIAILKEEIESLKIEIEKSQSHEMIEKIAREKLKMVKPNEIIYIIQDKEEEEEEKSSEDTLSD